MSGSGYYCERCGNELREQDYSVETDSGWLCEGCWDRLLDLSRDIEYKNYADMEGAKARKED